MPQTLTDPQALAKKYGVAVSPDDLAKKYGVGVQPDTSVAVTPPDDPAKHGFWQSLGDTTGLSDPESFVTGLRDMVLNPMKGIQEGTAHSVNKLISAYDAYKKGDVSTAVKEGTRAIPLVGEPIENAAEQLRAGNYPGAAGTALGVAAPAMVGAAGPAIKARMGAFRVAKAAKNVVKFAEQMHTDLMEAIPPSKSSPYELVDVKRAGPYLHVENQMAPIQGVVDFTEASNSAITQIEHQVQTYIDAFPSDTIQVDPLATVKSKLKSNARGSDVAAGLSELDDMGLGPNMTLREADAARMRLNAENSANLKKNNYDAATARRSDPKFAAREIAAETLRDGIYGRLEARGVPGADELRMDEGSLIRIRNAAESHKYNAGRSVSGTGTDSRIAKGTAELIKKGATAAGAAAMGPTGAVIGAGVGDTVAEMVAKPNLTRDALLARAFKKYTATPPTFPTVPPQPQIAGLLPAPRSPIAPATAGTPVTPPQSSSPIPMGPSPDTSAVSTIPGSGTVFSERPGDRLLMPPRESPLPATAQQFQNLERPGETAPNFRMPQNDPHITDASKVEAIPARGVLVQDPVTKRFRRVFTTEAEKPMTPGELADFKSQVEGVAKRVKLSPELWKGDPLEHVVDVPWVVAPKAADIHVAVQPRLHSGDFKVATVKPTKDWIATQPIIDSREVAQRAFTKAQALKMFKAGGKNGPPVIVKSGGQTIIVEGHHRFATAMKKGDGVRTVIIDLGGKK